MLHVVVFTILCENLLKIYSLPFGNVLPKLWNKAVGESEVLPQLIDAMNLHTDSLAVFKSCLLNYYFTSVDITYDPENPRTFRSLCLKCNCVRSLASPISCCY